MDKDDYEFLRWLELMLCAPTPVSVSLAHKAIVERLKSVPQKGVE